MKKIILGLMLLIMPFVCAKTADSKDFSHNSQKSFMASVAAINSLNFQIEEMQSKSGYILFKTPNNDEYFITVSENSTQTNIKISRVKNSSPISEIREILFNKITEELQNTYTKAD